MTAKTHDYGNLTVQIRHNTGKGAARTLRRQKLIPGVIYGKGGENLPIFLSPFEFNRAIHPGFRINTFFTLTIQEEGKPDRSEFCVPTDQQKHAIREEILHIDFLRVNPDLDIIRDVPVKYIGRAVGMVAGGQLTTSVRSLRVAAKPAAIPEVITVDVTPLEVGQTLRIRDLVLENARVLAKPDQTLAHVAPPKAKAVEEPATPAKK